MTNPHTYGVQDVLVFKTSSYGANTPVPWSGVKEVQLDRAYRDNYKVHNDGVFADYLLFGEEVGVSVSCYSYPGIVSSLVGRRVDKTGVVIDGGRPTPFTMMFRFEKEDGDYGYFYLPRVLLTPSGVKHATLSDSVEPVEYGFSGEVIPVMGSKYRPSVYTIEVGEGFARDFMDEVVRYSEAVSRAYSAVKRRNAALTEYYMAVGMEYLDYLNEGLYDPVHPPSLHGSSYLSFNRFLNVFLSPRVAYNTVEDIGEAIQYFNNTVDSLEEEAETYAREISNLKQQ